VFSLERVLSGLERVLSGTISMFCILYSVICLRGNGVIHRTQKVIQGDDNGHVSIQYSVGRPCEVSLAPPCPELVCRSINVSDDRPREEGNDGSKIMFS